MNKSYNNNNIKMSPLKGNKLFKKFSLWLDFRHIKLIVGNGSVSGESSVY